MSESLWTQRCFSTNIIDQQTVSKRIYRYIVPNAFQSARTTPAPCRNVRLGASCKSSRKQNSNVRLAGKKTKVFKITEYIVITSEQVTGSILHCNSPDPLTGSAHERLHRSIAGAKVVWPGQPDERGPWSGQCSFRAVYGKESGSGIHVFWHFCDVFCIADQTKPKAGDASEATRSYWQPICASCWLQSVCDRGRSCRWWWLFVGERSVTGSGSDAESMRQKWAFEVETQTVWREMGIQKTSRRKVSWLLCWGVFARSMVKLYGWLQWWLCCAREK